MPMKQLKTFFSDPLVRTITRYIVSVLLCLIIFLIVFFTGERSVVTTINSFFVSGACVLGLGFFSLVNHFGGMDFFRYATITTAAFLKKNPEKPFEDLVEYRDYKNKQRQFEGPVFLPYIIVGSIFLVVALIIYFVYKY